MIVPVSPLYPTHKDLPDTDGSIVQNFLELPQTMLLTGSIRPYLDRLHPDGNYLIGMDSGIYWRRTDPPLDGCKAPDWFYVPNVPPLLDGEVRRSYVLFNEGIAPLLVIEYVSGDGSEERDTTPIRGKFWVYEQGIHATYYAIHDHWTGRLEVFERIRSRYRHVEPNEFGHYPIPEMEVALGLWHGHYHGNSVPWLRFHDLKGHLFPTLEQQAALAQERAEQEKQRAEQESRQKLAAEEKARRLAEKLRAMGVDPDQV